MNSRLIMLVTWLLGFGISLVVVIGLDLFSLRAGPGATGNDLKIVFGVFAPYLTTMTVYFVSKPYAQSPPRWNQGPTLVAIVTSFFFNAIMVGPSIGYYFSKT